MRFAETGLPGALVDVLARQGIEEPFEVQSLTIPHALDGRDVAGRAPTGSGKTLAFGLPVLTGLDRAKPRRPRVLILAPTRELAEQIRRQLDPLADAVDRRVLAVYGGAAINPQIKALKRGVEVLVACPGRLLDLLEQSALTLADVDRVVIDEADRMADMGFLPVVRELLDLTSPRRQTLLYSATLDDEVAVLCRQYQTDPVRIEVGEATPDLSQVDHRFIATDKTVKLRLAADLIEDHGPTVLFCRTRHGVDRVARQLKRVGVKTGWLHGGRTQAQRDAALSAFTTGRVAVLVATDVAARGIHVDGVACVIHYDPPADHKDYVHRSGRTARAGAGGVVVSLVNRDQKRAVARLRRDVGLPEGDPEPTPPLRPRRQETWVDERPSRKGSRVKSGDKRERPAKAKSGDRGEAKPHPTEGKAKSKGKPRPTEGKAKSEAKPRSAGGKAKHQPKVKADGKPRPKRASGPKTTTASKAKTKTTAGPTAETRAGKATGSGDAAKTASGPERKAGKAKAKARPKAKGAKKRTTKRSGRPRTKDHKQRRIR